MAVPSYPVDGIKEQISCELHQKVKNISLKVAVGSALPFPREARWQGREIPAGYAKVTVDGIVMGFDSMELDITGPEGERTLGEVLDGIILWEKNNIKLPGSAPRPTPPSSRRRSPSPARSPPQEYINTARVHLDLRRRTWVGRLRRRLCQLRTISGSMLRR